MNIRNRQDNILRLLRRSGSTTLNALAQDIGVSRRTILRDLATLREEGFIIHSESGRGGGISLDPHSMQTAARLSVSEIFALIISVESMRAAQQFPFASLADQGLSKLEKSLSSDKVRDLRRLLAALYIGPLAPQVDISNLGEMDPLLLPTFELSFLKRHLLRFDYQDAKGAKSQRTVEPQALLILPPLWYLVAWDPMRQDFRHFRMDRLTAPECLTETSYNRRHVAFPKGINPQRYY